MEIKHYITPTYVKLPLLLCSTKTIILLNVVRARVKAPETFVQ